MTDYSFSGVIFVVNHTHNVSCLSRGTDIHAGSTRLVNNIDVQWCLGEGCAIFWVI